MKHLTSIDYFIISMIVIGFTYCFWLMYQMAIEKRKEDKEDEIRRKNRKMQPRPENPADQ